MTDQINMIRQKRQFLWAYVVRILCSFNEHTCGYSVYC
jgi:hypothetical protein